MIIHDDSDSVDDYLHKELDFEDPEEENAEEKWNAET
jgi:hypothetical protein